MEEELKKQIDLKRVPKHVAVIMDGNGRWAKNKGEDRIFGHTNGVRSVKNTLVAATELGIDHLTLYAFSSENWNRPKEEVDALMDLLVSTLMNEIEELHNNGVRLSAIGDLEMIPESCRNALKQGIKDTKDNTKINLILALSYGSRKEIAEAAKILAKKLKSGEIQEEDITPEAISKELYTKDIPDPDLLIRTSGETRISNFLLYQAAYAELYFTPILWPDFDKSEFYKAILDYQKRERRFGKISEQISI
ncbi:isoprenyl transferase [Luteibaculum oceani]|uniref:Isoprenyl transferase n=1 Tax=Luteibaculum oceani TaxID=1294296 RepID=A0A5C6V1N3_9FLAO|nr:isoprenyl transferase [Luteibaculum oceani]TXC78904.1 isoprenyl transferase [Luteibaculum oceani]